MPPKKGTTIYVPRDLDDKAKDTWRDLLAHLKERGEPDFIAVTDLPFLEQFCRSQMIARLALDRIVAREKDEPGTGWQTFGAQKQLVQHPDVKTYWQALDKMNGAGVALMLSPKERQAHGLKVAGEGGGKFGL